MQNLHSKEAISPEIGEYHYSHKLYFGLDLK